MTTKQDWIGKPLKIIQKTLTDKKEYRLRILKSCNNSIVLFIFFIPLQAVLLFLAYLEIKE